MKTTGGLHQHKGLTALTGAFLVAATLAGCGNEKINDLQVRFGNLPVVPTEIVLQKEEPLTTGGHTVAPVLRQAMNADKTDFVRPASFDNLTSTSEPPSAALPSATVPVPHPTQCRVQCPVGGVATPLREEKINDPQVKHESPPVDQTGIVLQKKEPLTIGGDTAAPVLRQAMNADKTDFVRPAPSDKLTSTSELPLAVELPAALPPEAAPVPYSKQCWVGDVAAPLREVVTELEKKSLLYATEPLTDCSGIFHRVLMGLKNQCPAKEFPSVAKYRDSRALARWYHERGKLQLIRNAAESTDLLKPGSVLFFGRNGSVYKDFSVDDLLTPRKGIAHLGVVVKVHKNKSGQVVHYELFHGHGRKGKTPASITNWHKRTPTRTSYPPFGNGRQQLVAVARL
ncbi:MAG: hypothetical protein ACL93V_14595 [Candidatus Electrothrix sp. YB6]